MKSQNRKWLFTGILLILGAFVSVLGAFYIILNEQGKRSEELGMLKEQFLAVNAERDVAQKQVSRLEQKVGQSINLKKLLVVAARVYGQEDREKNEGD